LESGGTSGGFASNGEYLPVPRYALELVFSPVLEIKSGAGDKRWDGARHKDLPRLSKC
jgi:hypothetical protein